jgi:hypothetical protein
MGSPLWTHESRGRRPARRPVSRASYPTTFADAQRNLDEAGVPRDVAMSITGHKTESMYRRYNIVNLKRQRSGLELAQEFRDSQAAKAAQELNVVATKR